MNSRMRYLQINNVAQQLMFETREFNFSFSRHILLKKKNERTFVLEAKMQENQGKILRRGFESSVTIKKVIRTCLLLAVYIKDQAGKGVGAWVFLVGGLVLTMVVGGSNSEK